MIKKKNITNAMEYEILNICKTSKEQKGTDMQENCDYIQSIMEEKYGGKWNVTIVEEDGNSGHSLYFHDKKYINFSKGGWTYFVYLHKY